MRLNLCPPPLSCRAPCCCGLRASLFCCAGRPRCTAPPFEAHPASGRAVCLFPQHAVSLTVSHPFPPPRPHRAVDHVAALALHDNVEALAFSSGYGVTLARLAPARSDAAEVAPVQWCRAVSTSELAMGLGKHPQQDRLTNSGITALAFGGSVYCLRNPKVGWSSTLPWPGGPISPPFFFFLSCPPGAGHTPLPSRHCLPPVPTPSFTLTGCRRWQGAARCCQ